MLIAAIILAAGEARRMGQPKQLLPYAGTTLLGATVAHARPLVDLLVVVLGAHAAAIRAGCDLGDALVVTNPDHATGQASSLRAGVAALAALPAVTAAVALLGDQPTLRPAALGQVIARFRATGAAAVIPRYGGRRGHPMLFARSAWPALLAARGDQGARGILDAGLIAPIAVVDLPAAWYPVDIDTPDEYRRLLDGAMRSEADGD